MEKIETGFGTFRTTISPSRPLGLSFLWWNERIDGNKTGTGLFDLDITKMDEGWSKGLPNTDTAIVSAVHWFFRPIFIHRGDETLGCIYCNLQNMTQISLDEGFKLLYSAVFKHIDDCEKCKEDLVTVLRTISPAYFENGAWDTGGACSRTSPFGENQNDLSFTAYRFSIFCSELSSHLYTEFFADKPL